MPMMRASPWHPHMRYVTCEGQNDEWPRWWELHRLGLRYVFLHYCIATTRGGQAGWEGCAGRWWRWLEMHLHLKPMVCFFIFLFLSLLTIIYSYSTHMNLLWSRPPPVLHLHFHLCHCLPPPSFPLDVPQFNEHQEHKWGLGTRLMHLEHVCFFFLFSFLFSVA